MLVPLFLIAYFIPFFFAAGRWAKPQAIRLLIYRERHSDRCAGGKISATPILRCLHQ